MDILLLTLIVFAVSMSVMGVGVIVRGKCLRGSCGGPEILSSDGEKITCSVCGRKKPARSVEEGVA